MRNRASMLCLLVLACGAREQATQEQTTEPTGEALTRISEDGPIKATVTLVPAKPSLAEQISLTLTVEAQAGIEVEMPPFGEALGQFSIVAPFIPMKAQQKEDGSIVKSQVYRLEAPMSGRHRIPSLRIEWVDARDPAKGNDAKVRELLTDELSLEIASVIPEGAVTGEMRPARGELPLGTGSFIGRYWPLFALGAAFLCIVTAVFLWRRGATRRVQISAYDVAMGRLTRLDESGLPGPEAADSWYVELSGVVRRYLEDRFALRAPELTTEEFLHEAKRSSQLSTEHRKLLTALLENCDRVKFAAYHPEQAESRSALDVSRQFVQETRLVKEAA